MSSPPSGINRFRAYLQFIAAVLYFFLARSFAWRAAQGLLSDAWHPLLEQAILAGLLILGYATMGLVFDRQAHPIREQGLCRRPGWPSEAALGLAFGWGLAVVCVLAMALAGGIAIVLVPGLAAWCWLVADVAFFALAALVEEVAFRGYGFQRFASAVGPLGATLGFAAYYAIVQSITPGASHASIAVSIAFSLLLSTAYLRSRALILSWGLNFAWKASRALLFGLAISGVNVHSPVVQGDPMGSFWLTGGGYGLDGSWFAFFVLIAALPFLFRVTRDLDFRYNAPVLVPAGIPVDLDAAARSQHEAAMGPAQPAGATLVQILPVTPQPSPGTYPPNPPNDASRQPR